MPSKPQRHPNALVVAISMTPRLQAQQVTQTPNPKSPQPQNPETNPNALQPPLNPKNSTTLKLSYFEHPHPLWAEILSLGAPGTLWVGHCRDTLGWHSRGTLSGWEFRTLWGWALQGHFGVGHSWDTLFWVWARGWARSRPGEEKS